MATVPSINKLAALSGPGSFDYGDIMLLNQLGVLHRMKRYSRRYYINPDATIGSDSKKADTSGVPFDRPLLTLAAAISYCESGRGDFIILEDSTTAILEEDVSIAKADVTIVGMADPLSAVGGFVPDAAVTAAILALTAAADNVLLKRLKFSNAFGLRSIITTANGTDYLTIEDCLFTVAGAASADIGYGINMSAAASRMPVIRRNTFMVGTLVQNAMQIKASTTGGLIEDNKIINSLNASGTGAVIAINIATGTGVVVKGNHIHGGPTAASAYNFGSGITIASGVLNTILTGPNYAGFCDDVATNCVTDGGTSTIGVTSGTVKLT